MRLTTWLDVQEQQHQFILLEAEAAPSRWTAGVIQYADRILLVGGSERDSQLSMVEQEYLQASTTQQILVLVHPEKTRMPSGTAQWLSCRNVSRHFHIRENFEPDIHRLARFLAGRSIGLVLGGGGARGFAHIGIIKAFRESGIPIDMVGGTSMGAVFAAHAAMELEIDEMIVRNRRAWVEERPFRKHLLPIFSFYQSRKLDEVTHQILYQDNRIEDLWLPCFFVSCSLGTSELIVHERGKVWEAIRASTALPGVVTPVFHDDLLHVDGGLMNNLPVDLMQSRCPGRIVAVEASDMTDLDAQLLKPPSLVSYIKNRLTGRKEQHTFPGVLEILMRSLLLGSVQNVKRARQEADLMLNPPVEQFSLLEFEVIEEVAEVGYRYALEALSAWKADL